MTSLMRGAPVLGVLMLSLLGKPASAADLAEPVIEIHDWSGFYVGVIGGYSWSDFDINNDVPDEEPFDRSQVLDVDDGFIGGEIGWNHQIDSIVLGAAADISYSWAKNDALEDTEGGDEFYVGSQDYLATIRGRLGYAMDRVLVYATGGLAITDAQLRYQNFTTDGDLEERSTSSDTLLGWTIGAGVEIALSETVSIKGEYLYADFESLDYDFLDVTDSLSGEVDIDTQMVRGGILVHF